jgi:hypothetical protein
MRREAMSTKKRQCHNFDNPIFEHDYQETTNSTVTQAKEQVSVKYRRTGTNQLKRQLLSLEWSQLDIT